MAHCKIKAALFLRLPFPVMFLCFVENSLWPVKSFSHQKITDSGRFLTSAALTAKPTLWKTSVDHKCLQLKEEASGIIDKLSPKYGGTRRILHQLLRVPAGTVKQIHGLDLWVSLMKSTDSCSNFRTRNKERGKCFLLLQRKALAFVNRSIAISVV